MKYKMPRTVILEDHEAERINQIAIAKYYQIDPRVVPELPEQLYWDTLEQLWFESQVAQDKAAKQKAAASRRKRR
jgi:hypothetical protein